MPVLAQPCPPSGGRILLPEEVSRRLRIAKRRFSEFSGEALCNQEETGGLEQGLDDEPEAVVAQGETFVLQQPGVAALDRPAPLPQARAVRPPAACAGEARPRTPGTARGGARRRSLCPRT